LYFPLRSRIGKRSSDGISLALGAIDGSVTLLDTSLKERKPIFDLHSEGIASLAFAPDGTRLLTSSYDGALKWVNAESGEVISDMVTGDDVAVHAVITPDGSQAISVGREVFKWDLSSAEKSCGFGLGNPRQERVDAVTISPDANLLATGEATPDHSSPAALVWSVETQELVATFKHRFPVMTVVFSPDSASNTGGGDMCSLGDSRGRWG
jgi:WD40 repeat protein